MLSQPPRARRYGLRVAASLALALTLAVTSVAVADAAAAEAKINNDPDFLQVYVNNVENLETVDANCRGDWQDLIYSMKRYSVSPDLFLVQQISNQAELNRLAKFMTDNLAGVYRGLAAVPNPPHESSPCGAEKDQQSTAIIYRTGRFDLVDKWTWTADRKYANGCRNSSQSRVVAIRAKLWDQVAKKHITAASTHWPTKHGDGPPCSTENAHEAASRIHDTGGSLMIWGGDFNYTDQNSNHGWRPWYAKVNADVGGSYGFRDVMHDHCTEGGGDGKACLRNDNWTIDPGRRIDFLFADKPNGLPATSAEHTIGLKEAGAADVHFTGTDRDDRHYSDHRAIRARIHY